MNEYLCRGHPLGCSPCCTAFSPTVGTQRIIFKSLKKAGLKVPDAECLAFLNQTVLLFLGASMLGLRGRCPAPKCFMCVKCSCFCCTPCLISLGICFPTLLFFSSYYSMISVCITISISSPCLCLLFIFNMISLGSPKVMWAEVPRWQCGS